MNYSPTHRKFTLALRTVDAYANDNVRTDGTTGETTFSWNINWRSIIPSDIEPNSNYICTHHFSEHQDFALYRDLLNDNRRDFNLISNITKYSHVTGYNQTTPSDDPAYNTRNNGALLNGFLNIMTEKDRTFTTYNTTSGGVEGLQTMICLGKYSCAPRKFEVMNPEQYPQITIMIKEMGNPITYETIITNTYYYNQNDQDDPPNIVSQYGNVLPQFYYLGFPGGLEEPLPVTAYDLLGTHVFEFELMDKYNSENHV